MPRRKNHTVSQSYLIRINALFLLVLYAYILLKPLIPYADYMIRKKFIIENFCINKEQPGKQCDGKCHLEEQVRKSVEKSDETDLPLIPQNEEKEMLEYLVPDQSKTTLCQMELMTGSDYHGNYSYQYVPAIFHPPMYG